MRCLFQEVTCSYSNGRHFSAPPLVSHPQETDENRTPKRCLPVHNHHPLHDPCKALFRSSGVRNRLHHQDSGVPPPWHNPPQVFFSVTCCRNLAPSELLRCPVPAGRQSGGKRHVVPAEKKVVPTGSSKRCGRPFKPSKVSDQPECERQVGGNSTHSSCLQACRPAGKQQHSVLDASQCTLASVCMA